MISRYGFNRSKQRKQRPELCPPPLSPLPPVKSFPIRACANCEAEQGILNRADSAKTHGQCHRHFVSVLLAGGIERAEIDAAVAGMSSTAFCPDLSLKEAA